MTMRSFTSRYTPPAIVLHWTMALLIVFVGAIGLLWDDIPRPARPMWLNLHVIFGLAILILVVVRFAWRQAHRPPNPPAGLDQRLQQAGIVTHFALYATMLAVPIVGLASFLWRARPIDFGLFAVSFPIAADRALAHTSQEVHQVLAYILFGFAGLHILAALWHQFVRKDNLLERMVWKR